MREGRYALETDGLGKRYGRTWGLRDCTLELPAGRIAALVGPNGAGKSTLLRMAAGLATPSTGSLWIFGHSPQDRSGEVVGRIGYLDQERPQYKFLRVEEVMRLGRELNPTWDDTLAHRHLADLDIPPRARMAKLSIGQQAQVAMTLCLAKRPPMLVLDEPVAALDPLARHQLMGLLLGTVAEEGTTVVLSSHAISDLEAVCDFVIILHRSKVAVADNLDHLLRSHRLLVSADPQAHSRLRPPLTVVATTVTGRQTDVLVRTDGQVDDAVWDVREPTLEEIVLAYLRTDPDAPARATGRPGAGTGEGLS